MKMAYKALYRTYRPDDFEEMAGQKHIVQTLRNAIDKNQIAHAYLFCGPRGTGKTSTAKIFAKAINCTSEELQPCGMCENCIAAQKGTHPDIIEIDAASNNGVEEARNLIEKVKYAPLKGKYKIYIIDEVHMMSTGAFNALLKTIEEPPAHVIFILATTEPHKVLPTIISRCQRFDFTKVGKQEIIKRLNYICRQENIEVDDKVLENIAILSDGGMRDALSILDQCRAYSPDKITNQDVNDIYGVVSIQEICDLIDYVKEHQTKPLITKIEEIDRSGSDIKRLTTDLIEILKETVIYDYSKDENLLNVLSLEQVTKIKSNLTTKTRLEMIDILMDTFEKYRQAGNVASYFEIGMLKLMSICIDPLKETKIETKPIEKIEKTEKEVIEVKNEEIKEKQKTVENIQQEDVIETKEKEEIIIKETEVKKKRNGLDEEFVLRLLVGANKPEKARDNDKMNNISKYMLDMEYAKYARLLVDSTIVASAEGYIILSVPSSALANEINDLDKNSEFLEFTNILLDKAKKVFALTEEKTALIIQLFKDRSRTRSLPEPISFENHIEEKISEEEEQFNKLKSVFENIIVEEDS